MENAKEKTKLDIVKEKLLRFFKNEYVFCFLLLFAIGVCMFLYILLSNNFMLPINGDYVYQSYAFYAGGYHKMWEFIKTGEFPLFDYSNFLGANYIGTASFYYLFSPFFWLLLLCPSSLLYQGIFFNMILKFATGGLLFYVLLRKYFHLKKFTSIIGGVIYSFSGWNLFYIWFHFSDVSALFPLLLIGIERCLQQRKGGILTLSLFLIGITNYFFFFTFALLGVLYALYRWIYIYGVSKKRGYSAKQRWGVLLQGILYYLAGALLACVIVFPAMLVALDSGRGDSNLLIQFLQFFFKNPRRINEKLSLGSLKSFSQFFNKDNLKGLLKYIFVWNDRYIGGNEVIKARQDIGYIFTGFLFMNTDVWTMTVYHNGNLDNMAGGLFITTPIIMMLVPAIINGIKSKRPWTIFGMIAGIMMPFIPFSYYLFHGFTLLYGRWLLFVMSMALIFILCTFDNFNAIKKRYILLGFLLNVAIGIFFVAASKQSGKLTDQDKIYVIIFQFLYMVATWLVIGFSYIKWKWFKKIFFCMIVGEVAMSAIITVETKGYVDYHYLMGGPERMKEQQKIINDIKKKDKDFYRIYNVLATRSNVNLPSTFNYNGESVFSSTYDYDLNDFIYRSRMAYNGSWSMGYHEKRYYYDQFVGIKYYIVDKLDKNNDTFINDFYDGRINKDMDKQEYDLNMPWGYELYKSYKYYDVYVNTNFIELGFALDDYISSSSVGRSNPASQYEEMYSNVVIVENDDLEDFAEFNKLVSYQRKYERIYASDLNKSVSLREDCSQDYNKSAGHCFIQYPSNMDIHDHAKTMTRHLEHFEKQDITRDKMQSTLMSNEQFMHSRYDEFHFFGDEIIYETDEGKQICPMATEDNACYLNVSFKMGPRVLISLFNEDKLLTQDAHMDFHSSSSEEYEWKVERGFYVHEPVTKIVIEFVTDTGLHSLYRTGSSYMEQMNINFAYQEDITATQNKLKEYPLENVVYHTNSFDFTTNYDKDKIVVVHIPYDEGWRLKANDKDLKLYKVDGGFLGFIAPSGKTKYVLSYSTPKMPEGVFLSTSGLVLFIGLTALYSLFQTPIPNVLPLGSDESKKNKKEQKVKEKETKKEPDKNKKEEVTENATDHVEKEKKKKRIEKENKKHPKYKPTIKKKKKKWKKKK